MIVVTKAHRRSPHDRADMTPSQRRLKKIIVDSTLKVRDSLEGKDGALYDAVKSMPVDRIQALIDKTAWNESTQLVVDELHRDLVDEAVRTSKQPYKTPLTKATVNFPNGATPFTFNRSSPEAAAWARKSGANLIMDLTKTQRSLIQRIVADASMGKLDVWDVVRLLRNTIGLTEQQSVWVENNYQFVYQSNVRAGFTDSQARRLAKEASDRYYQRVLKYRAENIARTEILRAAQAGRQIAWDDGVSGGWIDPLSWKEWSTQEDDRTCEQCLEMNGVQVPYNQEFPEGDEPLHPSCRCTSFLIANPDLQDRADSLFSQTQSELDSRLAELLG